jgi:type VI secretion system protein ImpJ
VKPFLIKAPSAGIQWYDGLLLDQRHFDFQDRRAEQLVAYTAQSGSPYFWGVLQLDLDTQEIGQGKVTLGGLEALLPTGEVVSLGRTQLQFNDIRKNGLDLEVGKNAMLFVDRDGHSHTADQSLDEGAYEGESWVDQADTGEVRLKPSNYSVQLGTTVPDAALPLARVVCLRNGSFSLDESYVAPTPLVEEGSALYASCRDLAIRLRTKTGDAMKEAQQTSAVGAWFKAYGLSSGLLQLEAVLYSGVAHPFALFVALWHTAGHLAGATLDRAFPKPVPYNHRDIAASFDQAIQNIRLALEKWPDSYETRAFQWDKQERVFSVELTPGWLGESLKIEARSSSAAKDRLGVWLENAIIALKPDMRTERLRRTLGARRHLVKADGGLAFVPGEGGVVMELPARELKRPNEAEPGRNPDSYVLQVLNHDDADGTPSELILYVPKSLPAKVQTAPTPPAVVEVPPVPEPAEPVEAPTLNGEAPPAPPVASRSSDLLDELYREIGRLQFQLDRRKTAGKE